MAAFVLARYEFRGREALNTLFTVGLLFPVRVAILPLYLLLRQLGLLDSLLGVIIPQVAFALPVTILILVPFLRAIPVEIEDAAAIDGCSRLGFFWRILLPLSRPGLVTVGVLAFVASWNAYLLPLLVFNDPGIVHPAARSRRTSRPSTRRTRRRCSPSRRWRWCRPWCSSPSPSGASSAGSPVR